MFALFAVTGRRPAAPAAKPPQRGVLSPPSLSSYIKPAVIRPTINRSDTLSRYSPRALRLPASTAGPPSRRTGGMREAANHLPREELPKLRPPYGQAGINPKSIIAKPPVQAPCGPCTGGIAGKTKDMTLAGNVPKSL